MKSKEKRKRVAWNIFELDYKAMEVYLEDMALRGWMLKETNLFYATFERTDPKKVHFTVDVFEIPKYKGEKDPVEAKEYRDLCEAAGWNYIDGKGYLQFFYSEAEKPPKPIQTDLETEARIVSTSIWNRRVASVIVSILILTSLLFSHFPIGPENLMNNTNTLLALMLPLFWVYLIVVLVYLVLVRYQMQKKVDRQEIFESRNYGKARKRAWFLGVIPLFLGVSFAAGMLGDLLGGNQGIVIALVGTPVIILATHLASRWIQKDQQIKNDNLLYNGLTIVLLLLILILPPSMIIGEKGRGQGPLPEKYPLLSGGPWGDFEEEAAEEFRYYTQSSLLVPEYYEVRYPVNQQEGIYNYAYYRAISPGVAEYLYERLLDERGQDFREDHPINSLWDVERIGFIGSRNHVFILQDDKILQIRGNLDFRDEELIEDVERLFFRSSQQEGVIVTSP
ncbi:DUF2812 domain-containing protein [Isachenkonia alkalipeptolytica]|uniref:DUF2812 domain-containing protein n=1 Tax=Isachenkonia alkalipeptolytica TaxID=2565777 RepID=A0AA43XK77_9CLOT|nr:DUF2812 domain-containing protein [Isachenkonia alkalipeptolytica]NBG88420.1 DUF2812 domain-containing protein [Isachenkonia alkalipeptolytica]